MEETGASGKETRRVERVENVEGRQEGLGLARIKEDLR